MCLSFLHNEQQAGTWSEVTRLRSCVPCAIVPLQLIQGCALPGWRGAAEGKACSAVIPRDATILRDNHTCPRRIFQPATFLHA